MEVSNREEMLCVGTDKTVLTYPEGFFPHRSFRGRYFEGVLQELYVRTIIVEKDGIRTVFVGIEAGDVGGDWIEEIASLSGTSRENVFLSATHTHAAPHAGGFWKEDVADTEAGEKYQELCRKHVKESVQKALQTLQPAKAFYGESLCDINVNRDYAYEGTDGKITVPYIQASNPGGISDKRVSTVIFRGCDQQMIACIFNYAVHSNVTFYQVFGEGEGMLINGDIAGYAMKYIEERYPEATAMFTLAPAADQSPKYLANHRIFDREGNADWKYEGRAAGITLMEAQGSELGESVCSSIRQNTYTGILVDAIHAVESVIALNKKIEGAGGLVKKPENDYASQYKEKLDENFAYQENGTLEMNLSMVQIGNVVLVAIPAEIVTPIGIHIKKIVTDELGTKVIVITQCNNAYSYITDDEGYKKKTFEALASHFMPGTEERILQGIRELTVRLKK